MNERQYESPEQGKSLFPDEIMHRYDIALGLLFVLIGFLLRWFCLPGLGTRVPFLTFSPAIIGAALLGGRRAGLLATVLSALIADYFWIAPTGTLRIENVTDGVVLAIFVIMGMLISWMAERLKRANIHLRQIEAAQRQSLEDKVAEATATVMQTDRRFKTALSNAPIAVWEQDLDLRYLWLWDAQPEHGASDIVGRTDSQIWDSRYVAELETIKRGVIASGQAIRHVVAAAVPGKPARYFDLYAEPLQDKDARTIGIACAAIDITERRSLETQLRSMTESLEARVQEEIAAREAVQSRLARTELIRAIGDNSADAIYTKDTAGRFLYANAAVLAILGKRADEVLGRTDAEIHADPKQAAIVMANDRRIMQSGVPEVLQETFDAAHLGTRTFRSAKSPVYGNDGKIAGIVCVSSDITDMLATEQKLRDMAANLERRVQEEVSARETAQSQLVHAQRMEALGQLAGGITHDFNNVLNAVQGGSALIERFIDDRDRVLRLAHMIGDASARGVSITRRLLTFARRADLLSEPVKVAPMLEAVQEILSHTLGAGIGVVAETEADLPPLLGDKGQLETVLVNLATNARDAMPQGGKLHITAVLKVVRDEDRPVSAPNLKLGAYICISVSDNGSGMPPEILARASEPFYTTKGPGKGTGLGLAMARGFAEQSGGSLHIESELGRGTTVVLWFPVADEEAQQVNVPVEPAGTVNANAARGARLLVVDDDPIVLDTTAQQLEAQGFTVLRLASGSEALALLRAGEPIDLLVTDMSMPVMGGLTLV